MIKASALFWSFFIFWSLWTNHEVQLTAFELTQEKQQLRLTISIEQTDLFTYWDNFESMSTAQQKAQLNDYLQQTTQWWINDSSFSICDYHFQRKEGHLLLTGYFSTPPATIQHIRLKNQFLVDRLNDHLNIIHFKFNNRLRSFRMDQQRQQLVVDFF